MDVPGDLAADERTLVVRARAGDREAFDRIVLAYQARLRGHVARYVPSSQDTYDIVQEVFLEAYRQLSKVDPEKPFGPWLWSICRHRLRLYLSASAHFRSPPTRVLLRQRPLLSRGVLFPMLRTTA